MNKENAKLEKRADYVVNEINTRPIGITRAVKQIAKELFLSEKTIWNDLKKGRN